MTGRKFADAASGLVVGGLGGPEHQLLEDGQEEVFSRAEVEAGRIEHKAEAGGGSDQAVGTSSARADPCAADKR